MEDRIRAVYKAPGQSAEVRMVDNQLGALQSLVGGYIEVVTLNESSAIICNEEGRLRHLPHNVRFCGVDFVGPILIVGTDGDEFCSLNPLTEVWLADQLKQKKERTEVMWLCTNSDRPVGLVKKYDRMEERWKYYIGAGFGADEKRDVEYILRNGQRFYDLAMFRAFEEKE